MNKPPGRKSKPRGVCCRVFPALLFICYLEVIFWTSCLLLSCAPISAGELTDSHNYLLREKGNLGLAANSRSASSAAAYSAQQSFQVPALLERCVRADHSGSLRLLQEAVNLITFDRLQPGLTTLRIIEEDSSGLPAPHSGIKAIS